MLLIKQPFSREPDKLGKGKVNFKFEVYSLIVKPEEDTEQEGYHCHLGGDIS